jgi:hypothetical protein
MAHAPNEHIIVDEQLVVLINYVQSTFFLLSYVLVSFYMFITSNLENCGNQVRAATDVKSLLQHARILWQE